MATSKEHFSDINWSFWSIWPCWPLSPFLILFPQPSVTPCFLGFLMSFWLVLLRLCSLSPRICHSDLLFSLDTLGMILYPFPAPTTTLTLRVPNPCLISDLNSLLINPLALWTPPLWFFRGFLSPVCPKFIFSFPVTWARNLGVILFHNTSPFPRSMWFFF